MSRASLQAANTSYQAHSTLRRTTTWLISSNCNERFIWQCWDENAEIGYGQQYLLLHTPLLTTFLPERVSSWSRRVWTLHSTRHHTLQLRLTYKQTSVAPRFKPCAWLFLSCCCTLTRILLLIFSVLPPSIHVPFFFFFMSSIHLSKQSC